MCKPSGTWLSMTIDFVGRGGQVQQCVQHQPETGGSRHVPVWTDRPDGAAKTGQR